MRYQKVDLFGENRRVHIWQIRARRFVLHRHSIHVLLGKVAATRIDSVLFGGKLHAQPPRTLIRCLCVYPLRSYRGGVQRIKMKPGK